MRCHRRSRQSSSVRSLSPPLLSLSLSLLLSLLLFLCSGSMSAIGFLLRPSPISRPFLRNALNIFHTNAISLAAARENTGDSRKRSVNTKQMTGVVSPSVKPPKRRETIQTSGEKRDELKKTMKQRQWRQLIKDETELVLKDNYAKKGILDFKQNYKEMRRKRLAERGLLKKEKEKKASANAHPLLSPTPEDADAEAKKEKAPVAATAPKASEKLYDEKGERIFTIMNREKLASSPHTTNSSRENAKEKEEPDRPFTLPPGKFRPKQSLGQNYLSDQNYVNKIISAFQLERLKLPSQQSDQSGRQVIEIGPGMGALTRKLFPSFPEMLAIEVDQRAIEVLGEKFPELQVVHEDVLKFDFRGHSRDRLGGDKLAVVANLPYHIVSQVLFTLADAHTAIDLAVVTTQLEVAERITASPNTKDYGIPSVAMQLYGKPRMLFKIPPTVFYPVPKVDSALIAIDFTRPHPELSRVDKLQLRKVLSFSFQQRRKMLRRSLDELLKRDGLTLPEKWQTMRPEQLTPLDFIHLTVELYGERPTGAPEGPAWRNVRINE